MRFISFFIAALPMMATAHPYQPYQWDTPRRPQGSGSGIGTQCSDVDANGHLEWDSTTDDGFVIPDGRFQSCHALKTFKIRDVQRIGVGAFQNCAFLESVDWTFDYQHFPYIGAEAFKDCSKLTIREENYWWENDYGWINPPLPRVNSEFSVGDGAFDGIKRMISDECELLCPECSTFVCLHSFSDFCDDMDAKDAGYLDGKAYSEFYLKNAYYAGVAQATPDDDLSFAYVEAAQQYVAAAMAFTANESFAPTNLICQHEYATRNYLQKTCASGVEGTCAALLNRCAC